MLVKNWMTKEVFTIDENDSMSHAVHLMKEHNVRMLPVLKGSKLVGIVSDTDLKRASASDATTLEMHEILYLITKIKIKSIMSEKPITVPPDYTVEEAAELMTKHKVSGVPVVKAGGQLVGIITRDDLFKVLMSLSGFSKRGIQFGFQLDDRPGSIKEVTDVIRNSGGRIASILSSYEHVPAGFRAVHIRAYDLDRTKLPQLKKQLMDNTTVLYIVDHRENTREIFH